MIDLTVKSSRGQMKIQQMAFVLVGLTIFFGLVFIFYISLSLNNTQGDVENLRDKEALETVRKLSGTSEFSFTSSGDCSSCIDLDKVLMMKEINSYSEFFKNIELLQIVKIYPLTQGDLECNRQNYPNCKKITLVDNGGDFTAYGTFVSLCRYDHILKTNKCEMGKIIIASQEVDL